MTYLILVALMMIIQQGKFEQNSVENAEIYSHHHFSKKIREINILLRV